MLSARFGSFLLLHCIAARRIASHRIVLRFTITVGVGNSPKCGVDKTSLVAPNKQSGQMFWTEGTCTSCWDYSSAA